MRDTFNEINITPLTDIFLVLLIIMMVIAPMLNQQGISLRVPENVEAEQIEKEPLILTVQVTQDNKFYINNEEIAENDLNRTLKEAIKDYPDGLLIKADGDSSHGALVKVMDEARSAGVRAISLDQM